MPSYLTSIVLQWSADPLSDTTPTWTTISNDEIRDIEWWAGIDREGNDPEPGGMTVTLKNKLRKWEPLYGSNTIDTQQRFRLTVNGTQEGVWYTESFDLDYPDGQEFSWVTIGCGDGQTILALDDMPALDPPEAETYEDVVNFDEPWGYWRLGEPEGTRATARVITKVKGKGKKRRKIRRRRGVNYATREEAGGVSGPAGNYKNTPSLGAAGLILGDRDTAVLFETAGSEYVQIPMDDASTFAARNRMAAECWVKPTTLPTMQMFVSGPVLAGQSLWNLGAETSPANEFFFSVRDGSGADALVRGGTPASGSVFHLVGVWTGYSAQLWVNGVLISETVGIPGLTDATAGGSVLIGRDAGGTPGYTDGVIDEVAVYEHALSEERIAAHYQAGSERGYDQQTAGERIEAIATSDLWAETEIQTSGRDVLPIMHYGQPKLEELAEAVHAEGPRSMFFFNGDGNPVYLGFEWQETDANYNTVQWTFTDDGTGKPYQHVQLEYDFETFNEVLASHESGESVLVEDTTESGKRGRRVNSEYTDVLLVEHMNVEELAAVVLDYYKSPSKRPVTLTVDGHHCLAQILDLDIGHLIRVKKSGETGDPTDRMANIIGKRKMLDTSKHLTCTYTLSRGWPADEGEWLLGIDGYTEIGETTVLA